MYIYTYSLYIYILPLSKSLPGGFPAALPPPHWPRPLALATTPTLSLATLPLTFAFAATSLTMTPVTFAHGVSFPSFWITPSIITFVSPIIIMSIIFIDGLGRSLLPDTLALVFAERRYSAFPALSGKPGLDPRTLAHIVA